MSKTRASWPGFSQKKKEKKKKKKKEKERKDMPYVFPLEKLQLYAKLK